MLQFPLASPTVSRRLPGYHLSFNLVIQKQHLRLRLPFISGFSYAPTKRHQHHHTPLILPMFVCPGAITSLPLAQAGDAVVPKHVVTGSAWAHLNLCVVPSPVTILGRCLGMTPTKNNHIDDGSKPL